MHRNLNLGRGQYPSLSWTVHLLNKVKKELAVFCMEHSYKQFQLEHNLMHPTFHISQMAGGRSWATVSSEASKATGWQSVLPTHAGVGNIFPCNHVTLAQVGKYKVQFSGRHPTTSTSFQTRTKKRKLCTLKVKVNVTGDRQG